MTTSPAVPTAGARDSRGATVVLASALLLLLAALLVPTPARAAAPRVAPGIAASLACSGYRVVVDNSASAEPADLVLELTGAAARPVSVPAATRLEVSGPLVQAPATLVVSAGGQVLATATLAESCLELGGGVQAARVSARLRVDCSMAVRAHLRNRTRSPQDFTVRLGSRRVHAEVRPRRTLVWRAAGRAGQRVRVIHGGQVLAETRLPRADRCS